MKTYKAKSSAIRAAKRETENFEIIANQDGSFSYINLDLTSAEALVDGHLAELGKQGTQEVPEAEAEPALFRNVPSHYQAVLPLKSTTVKKMVVQNTSTIASPTKQVWEIADRMKKEDPNARRKDIIQACVDAGIAFNTARTQYQHYHKACKGEY